MTMAKTLFTLMLSMAVLAAGADAYAAGGKAARKKHDGEKTTQGNPPPEAPGSKPATDGEKFAKYLQKCHASYDEVDARIRKAGVHDAGYYPVPGFPYVRTDRLLSSYRGEVDGDINTLGTWMLQLRENDSIARDIELANMGMSKYERAALLNDLRTCAVWMTYAELDDPSTKARLFSAAQIPEQSLPAASASAMAGALAARRARITAEFSLPVKRLESPGPLKLWQVKPPQDAPELPKDFSQLPRDELGRVGLLMNVWTELAATYAPRLLIESGGDYDRIGAPVLTPKGPSVDANTPVVYYLPSYARVGMRTLVQINYFIWFSARVPQGEGDREAGTLDGLTWRVTLGDDGKPLMYESIRTSGFDHLWFPTGKIEPRKIDAPAFVPQEKMPKGEFAVRVQSGSHQLRRLLAMKEIKKPEAGSYELRPYEDLQTLALPGGGTRSLFGPDGMVPGSERKADQVYRDADLPEAGAMRQWGNYQASLLDQGQFDDPRLIEQFFTLPDAPPVQQAKEPSAESHADSKAERAPGDMGI